MICATNSFHQCLDQSSVRKIPELASATLRYDLGVRWCASQLADWQVSRSGEGLYRGHSVKRGVDRPLPQDRGPHGGAVPSSPVQRPGVYLLQPHTVAARLRSALGAHYPAAPTAERKDRGP